jgi:hypothetical protein
VREYAPAAHISAKQIQNFLIGIPDDQRYRCLLWLYAVRAKPRPISLKGAPRRQTSPT